MRRPHPFAGLIRLAYRRASMQSPRQIGGLCMRGLRTRLCALAFSAVGVAALTGPAPAQTAPIQAQSVSARVEALLAQLTDDEKLSLIHGRLPLFIPNRPADIVLSAGFVPVPGRSGRRRPPH